MTDLFTEAAREVEAERLTERCALAKVAVADLWPFLALAQSPAEFEHRLALTEERIAQRVDPELLGHTLAALKADFVEVQELSEESLPLRSTTAVVDRQTPAAPGEQIWHVGQQRWITVRAGQESDLPRQPDTRHNPYGNDSYFESAAEEGPNTGQTGTYPQFPAGPDPVDPLNSMFPMQPTAWTVPPNASWVERPMNLQPGAGKNASQSGVQLLDPMILLDRLASRQNISPVFHAVSRVLASAGYVDEGVQTGPGPNPDFFAGGTEGVSGDLQAGYPEDLSVVDPDNRANELYGAVPPQPSAGSGQGDAQPYSNPGARQAVQHTAPGGGQHAPYHLRKGNGGWYVVNAKGERKNSKPMSHEEAIRFQKALYKNVPGASESAKESRLSGDPSGHPGGKAQSALPFYDPRDFGVQVIGQVGDPNSMAGGNAPQPPQSMMPGGVGSIAQPPLSTDDSADPGGADLASKLMGTMPGAAGGLQQMLGTLDLLEISRAAANMVRERPTDLNPSGIPDEYDDRTWDSAAATHPRQPAEDRAVNTPQTPRDPIPQASSSDFQRELSEDEERLREGRLQAPWIQDERIISQGARAGTSAVLTGGGVR